MREIAERSLLIAVGLLITIGLILLVPRLVSNLLTNRTMLTYQDAVFDQTNQKELMPGAYPIGGRLASLNDEHIRSMQQAVEIDSTNRIAQWALARIALAADRPLLAARALESMKEGANKNPLLYLDMVTAFMQSGKASLVTQLYEEGEPSDFRKPINDTIALAYLQTDLIEQVVELRPFDLFANYHLWKRLNQAGEFRGAELYAHNLQEYPLEAISPDQPEFFEFAIAVIPDLIRDNLWDSSSAASVVAYLVWQHYDLSATERLLVQLAELFPDGPDWTFYLAELHHRRGAWNEAELAYRHTLQLDRDYSLAYMRLGMLAETRSEQCHSECDALLQEATEWYSQYGSLVQDETSDSPDPTEIVRPPWLRSECVFDECLLDEDRRFVAKSLDVPLEQVELGTNLVSNGRFQLWDEERPVDWRPGTYLGASENGGLYVLGQDNLTPSGSVGRILALRGGIQSDDTKTFAEFVGDSFYVSETSYLVSVRYMFQASPQSDPFLFLGDYSRPSGEVLIKRNLDSSVEGWRVYRTIVDGTNADSQLYIVLRTWGQGQLWIDDVSVSPIKLP